MATSAFEDSRDHHSTILLILTISVAYTTFRDYCMQRLLFRKELDGVIRVSEPQGKKDRVNLSLI